jgi:CPA2 family monovalent cation:H+ antiporter-2
MSFSFLQDFVLILAAAVLIIYISHRIKLPPVVGFLVTGILIGPGGFSLIRDSEAIDTLAEIGVVMLLFLIGLEFTFDRLKKIQRYFWLGGGLQVVATIALAALLFSLAGVPAKEALFFGFLVSLSSTAVVLKSLADRGETDSPQGRISLGVLIFQDLAIVPMIALVPVLADVRSGSLFAVLGRFLLSAGAIAAVFVVGRTLLPGVLRAIVSTRIREVFLLATILLCLGAAWLTSSLGLSLALGAFLAGVILSESEYSHQVVSDVLPFKDVFNSLFFISIGMLLHTSVVWRNGPTVAGLVLIILIVKVAVVLLTVRLLGFGGRIALIAALSLAQVGEFSFVLAGVGRSNGLLPENTFQIFLASSILTLLLTPLLIRVAPGLALRSEKAFGWKRRAGDTESAARAGRANHVIVAGFGLNGRNLAHVLREAGIDYVIVDLNPISYRKAAAAGESILFGDVSSPTILREAGIETARGIVFAISDPASARRGVKAARALGSENLFVLARTRYASEIDELYRMGADDVIPEEFETSIEIFTRVLGKYHIPRNIIDAQIKLLRGECYGVLRGTCELVRPSVERIADFLSAGTAETFYVVQGSWLSGMMLEETGLRMKTGATVIAVVRGEASFTSPGADFRIESGDTLVLVANHRDMDRAFGYLETGEADNSDMLSGEGIAPGRTLGGGPGLQGNRRGSRERGAIPEPPES